MWPKKFGFLSIVLSKMLMLMSVFFMTSLFLILCCHFMSNILLRHYILKVGNSFDYF